MQVTLILHVQWCFISVIKYPQLNLKLPDASVSGYSCLSLSLVKVLAV